jgi:DNA repair exonuclease SbcCD nuclease subunit
MRLAHLADLHVGYRQFDRSDARGMNQREADVEDAIARAVTDVIDQAPDVVVFAGDIFHSVRPPNGAVLFLLSQLIRLRVALPQAVLVMIAGDHDTAKALEAGCILPLFEQFGVAVAVREVRRVPVPGGLVTAVPNACIREGMPPPDPAAGLNVLVTHGDVPGFGAPAPNVKIDVDMVSTAGWHYVALGHYHACSRLAERMWYAGSLEWVATNPWEEQIRERMNDIPSKGWLLVDVASGATTFRPIPGRRLVQVLPIDATGMTAAEFDARLAGYVGEAQIDGAIARCVVTNVSRDLKHQINHKQVREWKARALNFNLDLRKPEAEQSTHASRARLHKPLDEQLAEFLGARTLDPAIDRAAFVERGLAAFQDVGLDPKRDPYTNELVPGL